MLTISHLTDTFLGSYEKPLDEGPLTLLLPSDLDSIGRLVQPPTRFAPANATTKRARLRSGDVLLPAKGGRYPATLVTAELAGYVASSGFFVLRPSFEVVPAYLAAYLNHPHTQRRLQGITNASTTVPVLNKAALLATTIDLPPIPVQQRLANLHQLWLHEQQLTERLLQQKAMLYQQAFQEAIHTATGSFLTA
ncbi:restriction endonuclease subunit S [Hymenobacter sp. BT507]|uniref:Restriction endonuclease subunit S n=1 Tax=Hymenobacter citatus TaxID=2763506 RepID=A0ABR7MMU9_9BACT|nr:restriction endonuclease subunit S [Hymenobacter citatus]MBC6612410.1 restriction endonuclease subunit S [Hymenobacter citatus]